MGNKLQSGNGGGTQSAKRSSSSRSKTTPLKFSKQEVTFGSYSESDFPSSGKQLLLAAIQTVDDKSNGGAASPHTGTDLNLATSSCGPYYQLPTIDCPNDAKYARSASTYDVEHPIAKANEAMFFKRQLEAIAARPENSVCADCTAKSGTWASVTYGTLLCPECVGWHRSLGTHVSFTQSTTLDLDSWTRPWLQTLERQGNVEANKVLEYHVPDPFRKPVSNVTSSSTRRNYIHAKYVERKFTKENFPPGTPPRPAIPDTENPGMLRSTYKKQKSYTKARQNFMGMIEFKLISGSNLVSVGTLRNSADPYVLFELGDRQAKSSYISNSLNPVWNEGPNENITLRIPWNGSDILRVSCWDHETVLKDALLGRALIDLRHLKGTARIQVKLFGGKSAPPLEPMRQFLDQAKHTLKTLTTNVSGNTQRASGRSNSVSRPSRHRRSASYASDDSGVVHGMNQFTHKRGGSVGVTGVLELELTLIDLS